MLRHSRGNAARLIFNISAALELSYRMLVPIALRSNLVMFIDTVCNRFSGMLFHVSRSLRLGGNIPGTERDDGLRRYLPGVLVASSVGIRSPGSRIVSLRQFFTLRHSSGSSARSSVYNSVRTSSRSYQQESTTSSRSSLSTSGFAQLARDDGLDSSDTTLVHSLNHSSSSKALRRSNSALSPRSFTSHSSSAHCGSDATHVDDIGSGSHVRKSPHANSCTIPNANGPEDPKGVKLQDYDHDVWAHWPALKPGRIPPYTLSNPYASYKVFGVLGAGCFGCVLYAEDPDGLPVAIKMVNVDSYLPENDSINLLSNELTVMAKAVGGMQSDCGVRHQDNARSERTTEIVGAPSPFLAHLLACWEDTVNIYYVMRFYPRMFHSHLKIDGEIEWRDAKIYCAQLALGLSDLHNGIGAMHRDLKPANIMLDHNGNAVLADFGSAYIPDPSTPFHLARGYDPYGTLGYQAPELLTPELETNGHDFKIDIFSLGMIFWEIITGIDSPIYKTKEDFYAEWDQLRRDLYLLDDPLAGDLLCKMLHPEPDTRLSIGEVLKHPFFYDIDLDVIRDGRCSPSYKPDPVPHCAEAPAISPFGVRPESFLGEYFSNVWRCAPERRRDARHDTLNHDTHNHDTPNHEVISF